MNQIIEKLSTYNIFNYLFPGTLFAYFIRLVVPVNFVQEDLLLAFFLYYFLGLIISRIGSVIIESIFRILKLAKKEKYEDYLYASKLDNKIQTLLEDRNTYRTLISLLLCLLLTKPIYSLKIKLNVSDTNMTIISFIVLFILFSISFIKQNKYISERIKCKIKSKEV